MNSCIYEGTVHHVRLKPINHAFHYRLFLMYLDLAELDSVFRDRLFWSNEQPNIASFQRRDHFGPSDEPLDETVRNRVQAATGLCPAGPIRLLTHLRYFGYCFNPVSFYYCWNQRDDALDFVVAEVSNTPWGEHHPYVIDMRSLSDSSQRNPVTFDKIFHVSPFMQMDQQYQWQVSAPGESLGVQMSNYQDGQRVFHASMAMERRLISQRSLARVLLRYPFMTGKVIAAIYWQALKLKLKGVPFVPHPDRIKELECLPS